ncbi:MAG: hypothetical protein JXX29_08740 [Deltaproteobacteria bacterium]|nr:hypothetical protein [Deltaproteobacteria bacterium]MBN2671747.1 hypothetical protein [Deltaproteobacteria bacterium]
MDTVSDFEDLLLLFHEHNVRYLIIGGLAFVFHAKPRYTKDMDIWVDFSEQNLMCANAALDAFGAPELLSSNDPSEVLQLGIAPNRLDFFLRVEGMNFEDAWETRVSSRYGEAPANWIGIDALLQIKSGIDKPKHQEDARVLRQVLEMKQK